MQAEEQAREDELRRREAEVALAEEAALARERELWAWVDQHGAAALAARLEALAAQAGELSATELVAPNELKPLESVLSRPLAPVDLGTVSREAALGARLQALAAREEASGILNAALQQLAEEEAFLARAEAAAERLRGVVEQRREQIRREEEERRLAEERAQQAEEERLRAEEEAQREEERRRAEALAAESKRIEAERLAAARARAAAQVQQRAPIALTQRAAAPAAGPVSGRKQTRLDVVGEVDFESESNFFTGFTENISHGGLFFATYGIKPRGTMIHVRFKLEGRTIEADGEVAWTRELSDLNPDLVPGLGIVFKNLKPGDQEFVDDFIARRVPLFVEM